MNSNKIQIEIAVDDKSSSSAFRRFSSELDSVGKKGASVSNSLATSWKGLAGVMAGVSFAAVAKQVIGIADQYTLLESRLRLVTDGADNLASVEQSLYDISLRTHQAQTDTVDLYTRMARATEQLNTPQSDLLALTESINQALIVSGASATESSAALIQLSQGLASGVLRGEEFNSVMEQTPRLAQAIADGLGVTIGQLRAMAKEGELTAEVVTKALLSQKDVIAAEYSQMTTTVSQAFTDLGTVTKDLIADANSASGATGDIVTAIQNLSSTIDANREGILSLFLSIINLASQAVQIVGNFGQSIQGMRAVAAGELSFFEYATSNAEELKAALEGIVPGVKEIDDKLEALAKKRKDVAESWTFTSEARIAKQEELKAIDATVAALEIEKNALQATQEKYIDTWQVAADANEKTAASTTTSVAKQVATVEKGEVEKIKAKQKTLHKQEELDLSYGAFLQRQNVLTADNYIDGWRGAFEGRKEAEDRANQESIAGATETTSVIVSEWSNAFESIQSSIADMVYEFDFSADAIIDIFRRMLAEMVAAIAMSGLKSAFLGLFNGNGFIGGLTSGLASAIGLGSSAGGAAGAAGAGLSLAGIGSKIGGWLGIGGGAGAGAAAGLAGGSGFVAGTGAGVGGMAATAAAGGTSAAGGGIGSIFAGGTMAGLATAAVGIGAVIALISAFGDRAPTIGEQLNAMNVSAQQLISAGLDEEFRQLDAATKELIPALDRATGASYNAATGILTTGSEIYAMAEAANMGSESLLRMNYKLNESTGAWEASATIVSKWQQEMQAASGAADAMVGAVSSMGSATSTAAGRIAGAASDISSILDGARRMSSHLVGGPGTPSYHAAGGIITSPVRWGGHVLGESGPEGIVPLPEGPGTLSKIIDRLDRLEAKQTVVQVFIGNEQIDGRIRVVADRLDADRVGGGRRYIS